MIYRDTTAIEAVNKGQDAPDAFYDPKHPSVLMATSKWHATDAWRGYTEIVPEPGYKEITEYTNDAGDTITVSDWVTGDWDDALDGHSSAEVEKKLAILQGVYGDLYVIFAPTSNVFSTAYSVLVRDPDTPINKGVLVGHKTRKFTEPDGSWRVRYHATDVVSYNAATGKYTLNTGGWNTMTTGKRMTEYLPSGYYVYRKNWVMYVHTPDGDVELKDGMEV